MAGSSLDIDLSQLTRVQRALLGVSSTRMDDLLGAVGTEVESQTRRRIDDEKRSPEGELWAPWSERYAKTRHSGHSLLQSEDHLLDSIQHLVMGADLQVGSNLVYANVHQEGFEDIPARPYLGTSRDDEQDILGVVDDFLGTQMAESGL